MQYSKENDLDIIFPTNDKSSQTPEQIEKYLNILEKTLKTQIVVYYVGRNMAIIRKFQTKVFPFDNTNNNSIPQMHFLSFPNTIIILYGTPKITKINYCIYIYI